MKKKRVAQSAFFNLRGLVGLLVCGAAVSSMLSGVLLAFHRPEALSTLSQRTLTFAERVVYQRAIEEVYWRHRIWPKERPDPKPSLDAAMPQAQLEEKVNNYLRNSQALEDSDHQLITTEQLQAEMDRMAKNTKDPEVLRELFEALGNDPFVIAECLARPVLAERTLAAVASLKEPLEAWRSRAGEQMATLVAPPITRYSAPLDYLNSGGRYNPAINAWTDTSTFNAPFARYYHTAVWTGSEMIVWGGISSGPTILNTGGRYNPSTDSWTATSTTNAPSARYQHTAVWTGSDMIVWGGVGGASNLSSGGRYNPTTDSWTVTSLTNAPSARYWHTAVWTGNEMIIWGGTNGFTPVNTGGRYNPSTDGWTATNTTNAPSARYVHTAVWTGSEMIIWGGVGTISVNTGGRYNPSTDIWISTSTANAPDARSGHTAVWTGSEMIVWGGFDGASFNTGARYNPITDIWTATSPTNAPAARNNHTAVWTGSEMIVWGGCWEWSSVDTDTDTNTNTDSDTDAHAYIYIYTNTHAHSEEHTTAQATPNPATALIVSSVKMRRLCRTAIARQGRLLRDNKLLEFALLSVSRGRIQAIRVRDSDIASKCAAFTDSQSGNRSNHAAGTIKSNDEARMTNSEGMSKLE